MSPSVSSPKFRSVITRHLRPALSLVIGDTTKSALKKVDVKTLGLNSPSSSGTS
jgi:hypothetical protein